MKRPPDPFLLSSLWTEFSILEFIGRTVIGLWVEGDNQALNSAYHFTVDGSWIQD